MCVLVVLARTKRWRDFLPNLQASGAVSRATILEDLSQDDFCAYLWEAARRGAAMESAQHGTHLMQVLQACAATHPGFQWSHLVDKETNMVKGLFAPQISPLPPRASLSLTPHPHLKPFAGSSVNNRSDCEDPAGTCCFGTLPPGRAALDGLGLSISISLPLMPAPSAVS